MRMRKVKYSFLNSLIYSRMKDFKMGSRTKQTRIRRKNKEKNTGRDRKNANENKGTTPKFAIHVEKKYTRRE